MRVAADQIAAASPFEPEKEAFHVPLIGSLHMYASNTVQRILRFQPQQELHGRFTRWEIIKQQLRVVLELDNYDLIKRLQEQLPQGKPWTKHYVVVGSVASIDLAQQEAFLAEVNRAYPLDASAITWPAPKLVFLGAVTAGESKVREEKLATGQKQKSRNLKWVRNAAKSAHPSSLNAPIENVVMRDAFAGKAIQKQQGKIKRGRRGKRGS